MTDRSIAVIAHRACPLDAPENSREGIAFAASVGADAVEIDLRLARDGVPVLSHDHTLWRVTRRPFPVRYTSARRLMGVRLRGSEETVPTFADVLEELPDGLGLAVDVKDGRSMAAAIDTLEEHHLLSRARLWSSHPGAVGVAADRAPANERAWLQNTTRPSAALAYLAGAKDFGATAVSVMDVSLTPEVVDGGRDLGLTVNSWVRTRDIQDRVIDCGPDAIVTDWPAEALRRITSG